MHVPRSRLRGRSLALVSAVGIAAATVVAAIPATAHAGAANASYPGSVPGWATPKAEVGTTAANTVVEGEIFLALPDYAAAQKFALAVSTPGSAVYRQYLSPAAWIAKYAPTAGEYAKVVKYVNSKDFTIVGEPTDREYLVFRGPASKIDAAFGTTLKNYAYLGKHLAAPDSAPTLPASLGSAVEGVSIDQGSTLTETDYVSQKNAAAAAAKAAPATAAKASAIKPAVCSTYFGQNYQTLPKAYGVTSFPTYNCGYTSTQVGGAYGTTKLATAGFSGKGQTVAIVDAYSDPTILKDTDEIDAQTGTQLLTKAQFSDISPPTSKWDDEALCQEPAGWQTEESIDVQSVHGQAPGANIIYSGGIDCEGGLDLAVSTILDSGSATIISNSYGDIGENLAQNVLVGEESKEFQAAGEGIGLYFSSGDYGDNSTLLGYTAPDWEASSPYVTAVGGTSLEVTSNNGYGGETAWGSFLDPVANGKYELPLQGEFYAGSSGGTSTQFAEPTYQKGLVPTSLSKSSNGGTGRVVPDISSIADPFTGFLIGVSPITNNNTLATGPFEQQTYGGTSLASPTFAGEVALAQSVEHVDIGFANPAIYALAASDPVAFRDTPATPPSLALGFTGSSGTNYRITLGDDESLASATGYDDATGLGSGNMNALVKLAKYGTSKAAS